MTNRGIIVVLGSPNDAQGNLSSIAIERCQQAYVEFQRHPNYKVLPTGGWGEHFNTTDQPHGYYTRRFLLECGVPDEAFLPCAESSNTFEDAALARPILATYPDTELIVVTSDFHEARAKFLFERELPERRIRLSTSTTDLPSDELAKRVAHEEQALKRLNGQGLSK